MSKFLLFDPDPIDQPSATDLVERQTWCALRIRIDERFVSRIWDKSLQRERSNLYLPAFPIAEWLIQNWWSLLNERCPWERVPTSDFGAPQLSWIKRHCLRAADSALLLPALYLFHDGRSLRVEWHADPQGSLPNMPGEFVTSGADALDSVATQESLAQFIHETLSHVGDLNDERVHQLRAQWRAIQTADTEVVQFCTLAGRMGIDPYDPIEMTEDLARFFEQSMTSPDHPLVCDLTEVTRPEWIEQQWTWITNVSQELQLKPIPFETSQALAGQWVSPARGQLTPAQFGYKLAREVRQKAGLEPTASLKSVEAIAQSVLGRPFRMEDRNHIPGQGIQAIIGRLSSGDPVAAGPPVPRDDNRRFLTARSLYHTLTTSEPSQRLVTKAYSWDQKASRAFAAELLAPRRALADRVTATEADAQTVEHLSREFQASTIVIEKQLENAGIPLLYE